MVIPNPLAQRTPLQIALRSGSSFLVSFGFLSRVQRRSLTAVYAFCRVVDDAVDGAAGATAAPEQLAYWREELARAEHGVPTSRVGKALAAAIERHGIATKHLSGVIDGVAMDLDTHQYATFTELERYCHLVASCVGLACLPIFGALGERPQHYAEHLGQALQLTNIRRDLASDAHAGRVYVPQNLLAKYGADSTWLKGQGPDHSYRPGGAVDAVASAISSRAQQHFAEARDAATPELRAQVLPAEIMAALYTELLQRLDRLGGETCRAPRVHLTMPQKLRIAWQTWRQIRRQH